MAAPNIYISELPSFLKNNKTNNFSKALPRENMSLAKKFFSSPTGKIIWYWLRRAIPYYSKLCHSAPERYRSFIWGSAPIQPWSAPTPLTIWTFWSGGPSNTATACQASWRKHQSNFKIIIVTPESIRAHLPDFPKIFNSVPIQQISDLVRLMLLERHGGIWMDHSILITKPLNWVIEALDSSNCEVLAFYNEFFDEYKPCKERPIIENGFLAAKRGSAFISAWRENYQRCIQSKNYSTYYKNHPSYDKLIANFRRNDDEHIAYFVCYLAAQETMLKSQKYRLILINAEDEYYHHYYHTPAPRNKRQFSEKMLLEEKEMTKTQPALIKITGGHRSRIDEHIKYNCYKKHSLLGEYL